MFNHEITRRCTGLEKFNEHLAASCRQKIKNERNKNLTNKNGLGRRVYYELRKMNPLNRCKKIKILSRLTLHEASSLDSV